MRQHDICVANYGENLARVMVLMRKAVLVLLMAVSVMLPLISVADQKTLPVLYWGTSGPNVRTLQARLAQWGYYKGGVDGVFRTGTSQAVRSFQAKNGLRADGVVGQATWRALGLAGAVTPARPANTTPVTPVTARSSQSSSVNLLARLVAAEARAEPYSGQVAVAAVILNRVSDSRFPKSLSGVIFQPHAFESVSNGLVWRRSPTKSELRAATDAINGWDPTYGSIFFWNPAKPVSRWIWSRPISLRIGSHVFAR
jgi:N-acetylmuramoyl-L-alanine amidase